MNILACLDSPENSRELIAKAEQLAVAMEAKLWLLHVVEADPDFVGFDVGPQSVRDTLAKEFQEEHDWLQQESASLRKKKVDAQALVVQGGVAEIILKELEKRAADIVIVGSHSSHKIKNLILGSVSNEVVRRSAKPVLLVPLQ